MTNRDPDADGGLASAYVDGDVDAAERALVEADVVLLALVERFRGVRASLGEPIEVATGSAGCGDRRGDEHGLRHRRVARSHAA